MDRLFVDTNIVIDLLQKREEFFVEAQELFTLADQKNIKLLTSSLTSANTHFFFQGIIMRRSPETSSQNSKLYANAYNSMKLLSFICNRI